MKKVLGVISLLSLMLVLVACGNESSNESQQSEEGERAEDELKIFTTVYPLQYFADRIAGDKAMVESILPPGADSHTYEPTSKEMVEIAEGDAFIYNGAGLESYAEQISDTVQPEGVRILEASEGVEVKEHVHKDEEEEQNHEHDHSSDESDHEHTEHAEEESHEGHNHGDQDPHIWLDPLKSITVAENIKNMLVELKPGQEEIFQKNFEELETELKKLDGKFHNELEQLPGNEIIVSHAAYGYWEQAYGIEQIAISGLSPINEPSQKELQSIIETAEQHGLNHVFFEQNVTPKVAETVRKEISAEPLRIHNLSVLTEEDITNEETYFTLMNRNLERLKEALSNASPAEEGSHGEEEHQEHDHSHD
ncbi:metal ABC transporter solute-binding protein, Zn/Mn family [Salimicrobium halophilum]|uniref:Zinc transport system substrate-binding protein n=1 Tax=Salimicrobium halophilum TaxID=86666 RepID=A0A1G8QY04_9BACI|nr:zinc ABC transporter substrate-binding protein [Salimicrobium halophilum]SDJ09596.1 zinc transport system substrate-binding protein [Salimicrobium halophilum]